MTSASGTMKHTAPLHSCYRLFPESPWTVSAARYPGHRR